MNLRRGLVLRGLWWRRGLSLALLVVAVVTTTSAALGPLYARASGESILQDDLRQAGAGGDLDFRTTITVSPASVLAAKKPRLPRPGSIPGFNRVVPAIQTEHAPPHYVGFSAFPLHHPDAPAATSMAWVDGQCKQLVIVRGRCPTRANEALASEQLVDAAGSHWALGSVLKVAAIQPFETASFPPPGRMTVVGVYRPRDAGSRFWFGQDFFAGAGSLFVTRDEFTGAPSGSLAQADFVYPLTANAVRLHDATSVATRVKALQRHFGLQGPATLTTDLPRVLAAARQQRSVGDVDTLLVTLQLTLLAWLVLFQVVSDAIEARGTEIAMAKLRGRTPFATLRFGLAEPLTILAAALPLGLLAAFGATKLFAATTFVSGVPVVLTWTSVWAALGAYAGGAVAAGVAAHRTLTRSVLDQWRRTERSPGRGRLTLVADIVLAALAVAGVAAVLVRRGTTGEGDTFPLLAPALLVFAVSIIGVRLLPPICRAISRRTRRTRHMATFLATSQVARRPVGLRLAALLAVAVGLATFGVAGESVAGANRAHRAAAEVGADRVAEVYFGPRVDPIVATHRADPRGRWAMAAATWLPDGGGSVIGTVLALDPSRLSAVAEPVAGGLPNRQLAKIIGGASVAPIDLTTHEVRVSLTATDLRGDVPPVLQFNFRTPRNPMLNVEGPAIRTGTHTYVVATPCAVQCSLRGITWDRPVTANTALSGTIELRSLNYRSGSHWKPVDLGFGHAGAWYALPPAGQASDHVTVGLHGVTDHFSNVNGGYGGIAFGADPAVLPAVSTPHALASGPGVPKLGTVQDNEPNTAHFRVVRVARALPVVLARGLLLNLRYLSDELPLFSSSANWQVWVGTHAPSDWRQRLAHVGLHVEQVSTVAARTRSLGRQAPALALLLLLICSLVGSVLAVGGTAISVSASSRRRSYEFAALRTLGVRGAVVLRAGVIEQLALLGAAVAIGFPTGWIAAWITMPVIPEFANPSPVALDATPDWVPTVGFAAAFVGLLVLAALVAGAALTRIAVPARLREAE